MTIGEAYQLAVEHHRAGRLAEAEALYRQIVAVAPRHADALHLLGVIAHQVGRNDVAVDLIRQAIVLAPAAADFYTNLGSALRQLGRADEAMAAFREAITLNPNSAVAHINLGVTLKEKGQLDQAIAQYRQAIALQPHSPLAHSNLGDALRETAQLDEAIAACRRAIALQPDYPEAYNNLGIALKDQGKPGEAIAAYRQAIKLRPNYPEAHSNLGNDLYATGHLDEAIASFRRALAHRPAYAEAQGNLGAALKDQGRLEEAVAAYRQALVLAPGSVSAHSNLLLTLHYLPGLEPQALVDERRRWSAQHAEPLRPCRTPHSNDRDPLRRLRVGYVSPDFREHSVAYFLENLLAGHDPAQVEVFCYSDVAQPDAVTARLRQHAAHWRDVFGLPDADLAGLIRRDGIDILVDLAGHTARHRLLVFARKPAPVQVTWLGYPDATGLPTIDYRLTDPIADPVGQCARGDTEELVRLPDTFACFRPADASPPVAPLPALARGSVTFASFHILAKLNDQLLEWWAAILQQVPAARLMMVATGLGDAPCRQRFLEFFGRHGICPERLAFRARGPLAEYLALHHEVDLLLDSHPFSGHTVSCHALWMGVPVVTLAGTRHCSRMVASVLTNVGLPELIARTPEEYVRLAVHLAADRPRLAHLRATLREKMAASPLLDGPRFVRNVEAAFREMWRAWCARQPAVLAP